jgi:glycine cleavage system aminomethyltransferase T
MPAEHAVPGTAVEIEIFGEEVPGTVAEEPLYDPNGERLRS